MSDVSWPGSTTSTRPIHVFLAALSLRNSAVSLDIITGGWKMRVVRRSI
jgi:hypothetical protein